MNGQTRLKILAWDETSMTPTLTIIRFKSFFLLCHVNVIKAHSI